MCMKKSILVAVGVGIAVAAILALGIAISFQTHDTSANISRNNTSESKHFEVNLEEKLGVAERPNP